MDQVKARLESERADLPVGKNGWDDEDLILWFLRDRKFDVDATVAKFIKTLVMIKTGLAGGHHLMFTFYLCHFNKYQGCKACDDIIL